MKLKSITLPDLGEGVTEGEIIKIKVSEGENIAMDQVLIEVMTDKASMEIPSSIEGTIKKIEVKEGDIVSIGTKLFTVKLSGEQLQESTIPKHKNLTENLEQSLEDSNNFDTKNQPPLRTDSTLAIPATRKLAKELGLSLTNIQGTGPKGEITRANLIQYVKAGLQSTTFNSNTTVTPSLPQNITEDKRESIRGVKRIMFENMLLSKTTIPHFTIVEQARVEHFAKIREEMKSRLEKQGLKPGWLAFFIKALIPVLKEFPIFNSFYDHQTKELVFRKDLNIGFAVDSPQGLVVPVLKNTQHKSLLDIIKEIQQLAEAVRQASIERENLKGASITLSNLGSLGGLYGTPIINPPEMAIMGIYRLFKQATLDSNAKLIEKPFINFSITCDHRFIDGATAARFLRSFIQKVEEPSLLLLN